MRDRPSIYIRPLESQDIPIIESWRRLPNWPDTALSILCQKERSACPVADYNREHILIAEDLAENPIGLAHISASGLPMGIAQYSVAIPNNKSRKFRVGRDLLLFSIGAAFRAFGFMKIFSLIDNSKSWLMKMCLKGGFRVEGDLSFAGIQSCPVGRVILTTTPEAWMTIWKDELIDRGCHVPWVRKWLLDEVVVHDLCQNVDGLKNLVNDDCIKKEVNINFRPITNNDGMPLRKVLA